MESTTYKGRVRPAKGPEQAFFAVFPRRTGEFRSADDQDVAGQVLDESPQIFRGAVLLACFEYQEPAVELEDTLSQRGWFESFGFGLQVQRMAFEEPRNPRCEIVLRGEVESPGHRQGAAVKAGELRCDAERLCRLRAAPAQQGEDRSAGF